MRGVSGGGWKGDSVRWGVKTELLLLVYSGSLFIVDAMEERNGDVQEEEEELPASRDDDSLGGEPLSSLTLRSFSRREM